MVINKEQRDEVFDRVSRVLEDMTLEDFLQQFDITPEETVFELYQSGLIDPELFEDLTGL